MLMMSFGETSTSSRPEQQLRPSSAPTNTCSADALSTALGMDSALDTPLIWTPITPGFRHGILAAGQIPYYVRQVCEGTGRPCAFRRSQVATLSTDDPGLRLRPPGSARNI